MEPELDNGSIVELVYLAAHRNEAMAVLDLLHVFLPGGLGGDLTEHGLGGGGRGGGWLQSHEGGSEECEVVREEERGAGGSQTEGGGKWSQGGGREQQRQRKKEQSSMRRRSHYRSSGSFSRIAQERGRHRQCHHSKT